MHLHGYFGIIWQMAKKLIILGVTGSIGMNAVDVVSSNPGLFDVVAVAALRSKSPCEAVAAVLGARAYVGEDAALKAIEENDADICLLSTVGISGLAPALAAIEKGMDIALATKEVMVMAGELVVAAARRRGVKIIPVDSEHSAIFQCLKPVRDEIGVAPKDVEKLILTASGGPFLDEPADLSKVTVAEALNHPRWKMGQKVTVDSATMMNKGFEMIEARWLFDVEMGKIDVVVHPESIVHSLVTYVDGATLAQLSPPDMRVAIQYALTYPERIPAEREKLDLARLGSLTFRAPDPKRFPCLDLVRQACAMGGCAPAILASADEWAVGRFLEGRIGYLDIARSIEFALGKAPDTPCDSLEAVMAANDWTWRTLASQFGG